MRIFGLSLVVLCCLSAAGPGVAQQTGSGVITADQKDIGKMETRIQKYEQALGVVIQLARPNHAMSNAMPSAIFRAAAGPSHGAASPTGNAICTARSIRRVGGCN